MKKLNWIETLWNPNNDWLLLRHQEKLHYVEDISDTAEAYFKEFQPCESKPCRYSESSFSEWEWNTDDPYIQFDLLNSILHRYPKSRIYGAFRLLTYDPETSWGQSVRVIGTGRELNYAESVDEVLLAKAIQESQAILSP